MTDQQSTKHPGEQGRPGLAAMLASVALVYFSAGKLGLALPYLGSHITLIWLPSGIAVAALMRWGYICWPGIFIGALATNYSIDANPLLDSCIALGNTLAPLLVARFLNRMQFHFILDRAHDILLLVIAAAIGMLVSAGGGVASLVLFGVMPVQDATIALVSWWTGDFIGVLLVAPLVLNISGDALKKFWAQKAEFLAWLSIMLTAGWGVFVFNNDAHGDSLPLVFLLLPFVVWSAIRFGIVGSSLGVLLPTMIAVTATSYRLGPLHGETVRQNLVFLWWYLATLVLINLMVAALQAARNRAEEALRRDSDFGRELTQSLPGIFYMVDSSGHFLMWNRKFEEVVQYSHEEVSRSNALDYFEGGERALIEKNIRRVFAEGETVVEAQLLAKNGTKIPYCFTGRRVVHQGKPVLVGMGVDISERSKSEQATRETMERFEIIFNTSPNAKLISRMSDGYIIDANEVFSRLTGYSKEELLGNTSLGMNFWVNPGDREKYVHELTTRRLCENFVTQFRRKDGSTFVSSVSGGIVTIQGVEYIVGNARDITESRRIEHENESLLRRYQTLLAASLDGIHVMDMHGNILEVNDTFCNMLGYTRQEAGQLNISDWNAQWSKEALLERLKNFVGKSARFETVHRRKDGSLIDVEVSTTGVEIDDRCFFFASSRDISERKRAEQKNDVLIRRHQALMNSALEGIHIMDLNGDVVEANDTFCRMLGYTREEAVNLNVSDWDAQWSREELMERFGSLMLVDGALFETRHRRKDGSLISVEVSTTGAEIDGKHYLYASSRDITARKETEAKLQRLIKLYDVLNQCNQAIMRCTSVEELLPLVCHDAVQFGGMKMAWIGWIDEVTQIVKPVASFGVGQEYLENIEISVKAGEPSGQGPTGIAIRENRPVWMQDFQSEASLEPWRELGARSGWAASAALPLHRNGTVIGTLNIYSGMVYAFDEAERNLLVGMATDISYALTRFAMLAERSKSEDEMRVAAVTFDTQEAIMITTPDARILRVNQAFSDITGYSKEDVIGQNPRIFQSGRHDAAFYSEMWSTLSTSGKWSGEIWDRRKDGSFYPKMMTITAVYDNDDNLTHYVAVFRDISSLKKSEQDIHQLAFYDSLTALPNRRLLLDRLQQGLAVSARSHRYGALLFLDLDHFKTINDTRGHAAGDLLLIEAARRLKSCVREGDSVARLGGDEFVVLLEELDSEVNEAANQTEMVAEKILLELGKPYALKDFECHLTVSIGIGLFINHNESAESLLQHADVAMYQAKSAGRNAIRFFDPQMQAALDARAALEADMRQALNKQQFCLHYQIQVDSLQRALGAEVLLRWNHPLHGLISPAQFIPLAEESGLIVTIGLWVLQAACEQLRVWQNDPLTRDLTLAVNVSARQFRQNDFVVQVQHVLQVSGARPSQLKLELTESVVLENVEDTIAKMRELKRLGVSFSMDDFGTGYSSLQYLKRLPLDQIKIDQSFVRDITTDPNDAAIVQTIIAMTDALGLNVIAEGVETEQQLEFLDLHGCHAFQGYLFSKPVPMEQFEALLLQDSRAFRHSSALP